MRSQLRIRRILRQKSERNSKVLPTSGLDHLLLANMEDIAHQRKRWRGEDDPIHRTRLGHD